MNAIIKQIAQDSHLDVYGLGTDRAKWDSTVTKFSNQLVGECVLAILATDTRSIVYTTWDRDQVAGIIARVVENVRNHFEEQNA
jgi:hypothetical protein